MNLDDLRTLAQSIRDEIGKAVYGQDEAVDLLLVCLLAEATACWKDRRAQPRPCWRSSAAASMHLDFGRIQFTPDLMPGDVLGASIFRFQHQPVPPDQGAGLHRHPAGGRDQPRAAQDPGRPLCR